MRRIFALLLAAALLLTVCGCNSEKNSPPPLETDLPGRQTSYDFSAETSDTLTLSEAGARSILDAVAAVPVTYELEALYDLDTVRQRMDFDATVENHSYSALNSAGKLEAAHFLSLVRSNNEAYLLEHTFGYEQVEEDYLRQLCGFMVTVVNTMKDQYPQLDWQRIYCNLGNLKILYNIGMLSYAQVNSEMVLSISRNNTQIVLTMKGENSFRDVLIHETMHILQMGCSCENIPECSRRAGICCYYNDLDFNAADWTWLVEGSAERHMCSLTGGSAVSYQYKMDYICSFTMSLLLRQQVQADTMENLCFQSDPQLLFDAFGCENQAQTDEVLKLMITMQILQIQPTAFYDLYEEAYGVDPSADTQTLNQLSYQLKIPVCMALAKEFYENLVAFLEKTPLPANDLFFLLNLYEGHLNQHLNYRNESKAQINAPFITHYNTMRQALFAALAQEHPELDIPAMYQQYTITTGDDLLNAELSMLSPEKRTFLAERAQWQAELIGLGVKVPETAVVIDD